MYSAGGKLRRSNDPKRSEDLQNDPEVRTRAGLSLHPPTVAGSGLLLVVHCTVLAPASRGQQHTRAPRRSPAQDFNEWSKTTLRKSWDEIADSIAGKDFDDFVHCVGALEAEESAAIRLSAPDGRGGNEASDGVDDRIDGDSRKRGEIMVAGTSVVIGQKQTGGGREEGVLPFNGCHYNIVCAPTADGVHWSGS